MENNLSLLVKKWNWSQMPGSTKLIKQNGGYRCSLSLFLMKEKTVLWEKQTSAIRSLNETKPINNARDWNYVITFTLYIERIPGLHIIVKYDVQKKLSETTIKVRGPPKYATAHGKDSRSNDSIQLEGELLLRVLPLSHCPQLALLSTVAMSNLYPVASTYNSKIQRWKNSFSLLFSRELQMNKWFEKTFGRDISITRSQLLVFCLVEITLRTR